MKYEWSIPVEVERKERCCDERNALFAHKEDEQDEMR